jgi:hypothetical protein
MAQSSTYQHLIDPGFLESVLVLKVAWDLD